MGLIVPTHCFTSAVLSDVNVRISVAPGERKKVFFPLEIDVERRGQEREGSMNLPASRYQRGQQSSLFDIKSPLLSINFFIESSVRAIADFIGLRGVIR